jgi:protein disulfide-isomerase A6
LTPIWLLGILKFAAVSDFFDQVLEGSIDISRASLDAKQEILKIPESERSSLSDETRIDESGYGGFNPHDGADMDELIKKYGNPHAAGHPGAPNPHQGGKAGAKAAAEPKKSGAKSSASQAESSSSKAASSEAEPPSSSAQVESADSEDQTSPKDASATPTAEHASADPAQGTEPAGEHAKDEL